MYTHFVEEHNLHAPICYTHRTSCRPPPSNAIHFDAIIFAFVLVKCKSWCDWWSKTKKPTNYWIFKRKRSGQPIPVPLAFVVEQRRLQHFKCETIDATMTHPTSIASMRWEHTKNVSMFGLESVRFILMNEYRSIRSIFRGVKLIKYMNRREN